MLTVPFLIALLISGDANPPGMCTCIEKPLDVQIADADLIFEGIVLEKRRYPVERLEHLGVERPSELGFGLSEYVFFFATKLWKGSSMRDLVVSTPIQESMCGYRFEEGQRYLVYANVWESQAMTSICTPTKPARKADEDRRRLGALFED